MKNELLNQSTFWNKQYLEGKYMRKIRNKYLEGNCQENVHEIFKKIQNIQNKIIFFLWIESRWLSLDDWGDKWH